MPLQYSNRFFGSYPLLKVMTALFCAFLLAVSGCYSKTMVKAEDMKGMLTTNSKSEIIFKGRGGGRVRMGPNSKIRFLLTNATRTKWYRGRDLLISRAGVWQKRKKHGEEEMIARWDEVSGARIKNLSGGKTYIAVVGAVVIAGVVILAIAGSGKGGNGLSGLGKGLAKGGKAVAKGAAKVAKGASRGGRALARGAARSGGAFARGVHGPHYYAGRPVFHMGLYVEPHVHHHVQHHVEVHEVHEIHDDSNHNDAHQDGHTPPHHEDGHPPPPPPSPEDAPPPPPPPPPPSLSGDHNEPPHPPSYNKVVEPKNRVPVAQNPTPLFSRTLMRRSRIRYMASVETGSDLILHDGLVTKALLGLRFNDTFELGLGAKLMLHRGTDTDDENANEKHKTSWMAFARFAFNFDIDERRIISLPVGLDVGVGHAQIDLRTLLGIRFKVMDIMKIGIYPFNPTYTRFKDETLKRKLGWWSFPSSVAVTFGF